MTQNQLQYWANQETIRANKAREGENNRHNLADESIRRDTNTIQSDKNRKEHERGVYANETSRRAQRSRSFSDYAKGTRYFTDALGNVVKTVGNIQDIGSAAQFGALW